jgi:hypothetical protein
MESSLGFSLANAGCGKGIPYRHTYSSPAWNIFLDYSAQHLRILHSGFIRNASHLVSPISLSLMM